MNKINNQKQLLQQYLADFHIDNPDDLTPSEIESIFMKARDDFFNGTVSPFELSEASKDLYKIIDNLTYEKRTHTASNLNKILDVAGLIHFLLLNASPALVSHLQALYAYPNYVNKPLDEIIDKSLLPYPTLSVDKTLTPEDAPAKGYQWVADVMYQTDAMEGTLDQVVNKVTIQGYKLGTSVTRMAAENTQGLYAPLKK